MRRELGVGPYDQLLLFGGTRARTRASSRCSRRSTASATTATSSRSSVWVSSRAGQPGPAARAVGAAAAVPALRRPGAAGRRRRPLVRPPGPLAPGRALPDAGEDHRCARHGRALPGDGPPPVQPLVDAGVVHVHDPAEPLHERIASIFDDPDDARDRARKGRALFLAEYSYEAVSEHVAPWFEQLVQDPGVLPNDVDALVKAPGACSRPAADQGPRRRRPGCAGARSRLPPLARRAGRAVRPRRVLEAERHVDLRTSSGHVPEVPAADGTVRQDRALRQPDLARDPHPHVPGEHRTGGPAPPRGAPDAAATGPSPRRGQRDPPHVPLRCEARLADLPPEPLGVPGVRQGGAGEARHRQPAHGVLGVPDERLPARDDRRARHPISWSPTWWTTTAPGTGPARSSTA